MNWIKNLFLSKINTKTIQKKLIPEGIWKKCIHCKSTLYYEELVKNLFVCMHCDYHHRLTARERLHQFLDNQNYVEIEYDLESKDKLKFKDTKKYKDRIYLAQKKTGEKDAMIVIKGTLNNYPIVLCIFEFNFMGGSMGTVVGQKFLKAIDIAIYEKRSLICFTASGGARIQEGLFSLMQMAKSSAALAKFYKYKLPFIVIQTNPTMGGVSASFASLGDIIIAEPNAIIGFTGPKVIEQTVKQTLPNNFQSSEFVLQHGHIDMIVHRNKLRSVISELISKFSYSI